MQHWVGLSSLGALLLGLLGCEASPSLFVDVKTDFVPGEEFVRVRTVVFHPGDDRVDREQEVAAAPSQDFLRGYRAAEFVDTVTGSRRVRVELMDATGRRVAERSVIVTLNSTRIVTVLLTRSCRDVQCPEAGGDAAATECLAGQCVPAECLEPSGCVTPECASDADCTFAADCATPLCEEGICLSGAGSCPSGQYCDSEAGCLPRADGLEDAGVPADAAPSDAGCADAAGCDDTFDCTDDTCEDGVCVHAPIDGRCSEGAEGQCIVDFGCQYAGCSRESCVAGPCETAHCDGDTCIIESTCGAGEECCGDACVALGCDDANPCTDDSCGATGCDHAANTATCGDGVFCNGADTCAGGSCSSHAGDPCGGSSVCDESSGSCVGCNDDGDCPSPIVGGWSSCDYSGTCDQNAQQMRPRTTYSCVSRTCRATMDTEVRSCSRSTTGTMCGSTSVGLWGACGNFSSLCDTSGTQTRTRTEERCASGSCRSTPTIEMQGCSRTTSGDTCAMATFTGWGACGDFAGPCDESGTESRTRTDFTCSSGTCGSAETVETQGCMRATEGTMCAEDTFTGWSPCFGFSTTCDETAAQTRDRTEYTCESGTCTAGPDIPEVQSCTRDTDGTFCENFTTCRTGTCADGACDAPGSCSGRCCEPNICVCRTCLCP